MGMISVSDGSGGGYSYWGSDDPINGMRNPHITFRPSDSEMVDEVSTEDCGNYTITYGYDQYGNPIAKVTAKSGGSKSMVEAIEKGINEGLWDLQQEGYFNLKDINKKNTRFTTLIKEMTKFALNNLKYFVESFLKGSDLNHSERVSLFFKHATIGTAVGSLLCHNQIGSEKDPGSRGTTDENFNAYDTDIGFWASFYNDIFDMGLSLNGNDTDLGLVQWGNLTKSLFMQESNMNPKAYHSDTGGIGMSVTQKEVQGTNTVLRDFRLGKNVHGFDWDKNSINPNAANTSAFYNIGAGMGHFVAKLAGEAGLITYDRNDVPHMKSFNNMTLTYEMWGDAVAAWGPHSEEKPFPPLPFYRKEVMERYLQYNHR
ncbi:hypothetical protein LLG10_08465 [bacterium]|nr:hypothetical protein [bacterium]